MRSFDAVLPTSVYSSNSDSLPMTSASNAYPPAISTTKTRTKAKKYGRHFRGLLNQAIFSIPILYKP